jgi:hypothetical protein
MHSFIQVCRICPNGVNATSYRHAFAPGALVRTIAFYYRRGVRAKQRSPAARATIFYSSCRTIHLSLVPDHSPAPLAQARTVVRAKHRSSMGRARAAHERSAPSAHPLFSGKLRRSGTFCARYVDRASVGPRPSAAARRESRTALFRPIARPRFSLPGPAAGCLPPTGTGSPRPSGSRCAADGWGPLRACAAGGAHTA